MEKRALLAVVLSVLILIIYQTFFYEPTKKPVPLKETSTEPEREEQEPILPDEGLTKPAQVKSREDQKTQTGELARVKRVGKTVKVETPLYSAVFSSLGGVVKTFSLKEYKDNDGLGVVLQKADPKMPAFSIGDSRNLVLSDYNFTVQSGDILLDKDSKAQIVFTLESNGIKVNRTYKFFGNSYKIDLRDEVEGLKGYYITIGSDFGITGAGGYGAHIGPVILQDFKRIEFKPDKKMESIKSYKEDIKWIALEDKYFFASLVPLSDVRETLIWNSEGTVLAAFSTDKKVNEFIIYAGPKKEELLKPLNVGLEHIIDFGFFSIISRPIFWLLKFINEFIGNYGWSIIVLTIVIRIPFIPLINKGQKSMKKLQKLQPMMNDLKEKYKKEPQRMQKEMMKIYKTHKVNPMGGCLPMVVQIPIFFALYKVLLVAIELRGAPFILWIHDLSAKDPYYVLPIVMGATMFLQQKMTPTTMDPRQAKIMMFMPVIFTFMFLNFSSGLVLYWLVSNVLSILQQIYVNKKAEVAKQES